MPSRVAVSVLFTDLVGSTAMAAELGASEAERLRVTHFELLRRGVEDHGGREVKNLGDGIMAVFTGTGNALDAAIAMQQAIDRHNTQHSDLALAVRIGISAGDCVEQDDDYFGEPVVEASRLCAVADGGQILTTAVVGMMAPRGEFELTDLGPLELKGLPDPTPSLELKWTPVPTPPVSDAPLQEHLVHGAPENFVGREHERAVLGDALKAAGEGERRVVLITGEGGLGKTSLVSTFARHAADTGALVVYGRCEEGLAVPYQPWAELISHLEEHARTEVDALDAPVRRELARLVPALRESNDAPMPATSVVAAPGEQYVLFRAVTSLLESLTASRTLVVILDDLHWADRSTLHLLRHVVGSMQTARLLIVAMYRDTEIDADVTLSETSTHLHREQGVDRLPLNGLSDQEVIALLEATAGHELEDDGVALAHSLRLETAGNPFFLVEMLRHLARTGIIEQQDDGRWVSTVDLQHVELPESVRDLVRQRVRHLTDDALPTLTTAAVVGRDFDVSLVARVMDADEDLVLDVLEQSMAAGLVRERSGADQFAFTHAVVQHCLYQELSASRRARTHRRIAETIEAEVGDDAGDRVGELANHWLAAVQPAEMDRVVKYAMQAGRRALDSLAPDEAVRWYLEAFEVIDEDSPQKCALLLQLGEAERQAGHPTYRQRLLDAAELALRHGDDQVLIASAVANHRGFHSASGEVDQERVDVLEAALERVSEDDLESRVRLLATLVGEITYGEPARRYELGREVTQLAGRLDDAATRFDAFQRLGSALSVPDLIDGRIARAEEGMRLTEGLDDPFRRFFALEMKVDAAIAAADMASARRCDAERSAIATTLGQPILQWVATNGTALLDLLEGDVEAAEEGAGRAFELGIETGQPDTMVYYGALLIQTRLHQGRSAELIPLVQERVESTPGLPAFRSVLALLHTLDGDTDSARRVFSDLTSDGLDFPYDIAWSTGCVVSAEVAVLLDDQPTAQTLYDQLLPYRDQIANTRTNCQGAISHYLGLLAACLGRPADAEPHFVRAQELNVGLRSPYHSARTLLGLADVVMDREPERGRTLAAEALDLARGHAMPTLERDAQTALSRS